MLQCYLTNKLIEILFTFISYLYVYIYIYIYNSEDVANYWVEKKQGLSI